MGSFHCASYLSSLWILTLEKTLFHLGLFLGLANTTFPWFFISLFDNSFSIPSLGSCYFPQPLSVTGPPEVYPWFSSCHSWRISLTSMPPFTIYMAPRFILSFIHQIFSWASSLHWAFCWALCVRLSAIIWLFQRHLIYNISKAIFCPKLHLPLDFFSWVLIPPSLPGQTQNYPISFFLMTGSQWPVNLIPFMFVTCHFFFTPAVPCYLLHCSWNLLWLSTFTTLQSILHSTILKKKSI